MAVRTRTAPKEHRHPIQVVVRRTGLSPDLLRVWEKRYAVVTPERSASGRRLYTDADVERLQLLRRATLGGRTIGQIATLPADQLRELLRRDAEAERDGGRPTGPAESAPTGRGPAATALLGECVKAIERLDAPSLDAVLRRAVVALPAEAFLDELVVPLLDLVGDRWRAGTLRPVHGHLASTVVRRALERVTEAAASPLASRHLLVATPAGQTHELGALLSAATAAAEGWRVTYLGASVPADDIAEAVTEVGARAVALSLVYPAGDPLVEDELRRLGERLHDGAVILAGGRAAGTYRKTLNAAGATVLGDLAALRTVLRGMADGDDS